MEKEVQQANKYIKYAQLFVFTEVHILITRKYICILLRLAKIGKLSTS
jgi:hypothetical protein